MYILQIEVSETIPASIHFFETSSKCIPYLHCMMLEWFQIIFRTHFCFQTLILWIRSHFQVVISPISQFAPRTNIFTREIFISRREYPGIQAETCILARGFDTYPGKGHSVQIGSGSKWVPGSLGTPKLDETLQNIEHMYSRSVFCWEKNKPA